MVSSQQQKHRRPQSQSWSMFPNLHDTVNRLLNQDNLFFTFHASDDDYGTKEEYDTNIMGRFVCRNNRCTQGGWSSKVVAITIRMYGDRQYNARVYHQRCKSCNRLSRPIPDDSYAERIAYRLKKWNGIEMNPPVYNGGDSERPHESALCEGCRHGHCGFY